jgi:glycogen operon protein
VRRFIRGDKGLLNELATRLTGSSDLYKDQGRLPINSINFVTCHDGFTLYDLLSYEQKHNEANGEGSRDGCNNNLSCNYGEEGTTENTAILSIRHQQAKNVVAILMLSQGIPMILAGDEVLNSQLGNNNSYCQDNELSWFDWRLIKKNQEMFRFVQLMIALRKSHPCLMRRQFLTGENINNRDIKDIIWYGKDLNSQPWDDQDASILSYTLASVEPAENDLHIILNMSSDAVQTELPNISGQKWYRAVDTSRKAPEDICEPKHQKLLRNYSYSVPPRTVIVLEGKKSKLKAFFHQ